MKARRLTSREANASQVADEQSKANTDWGDECGTVLLRGEHENGKYQERSQEHLDEEALGEVCAFGQSRCHGEFLSARMRSVSLSTFAKQNRGVDALVGTALSQCLHW